MEKCRTYLLCRDQNCRRFHYKGMNWEDRTLLTKVKDDNWSEISQHKEEKRPTAKPCYFYLMCFEKECPHYHGGVALEGRKVLKKKFRDVKRIADLEKEMRDMAAGTAPSMNWADMCK